MPRTVMNSYVLYTYKHVGDGLPPRWWGPDRSGYVTALRDAGVYTLEEAQEICAKSAHSPVAREHTQMCPVLEALCMESTLATRPNTVQALLDQRETLPPTLAELLAALRRRSEVTMYDGFPNATIYVDTTDPVVQEIVRMVLS